MDELEVRMRCIEAAAKLQMVHLEGTDKGVLRVAQLWAEWVLPVVHKSTTTLTLPNKK
jgi:hypothetical protein